ncbi:MAG: hypothetical protein ABI560_01385 [Myxococcales bacterium]
MTSVVPGAPACAPRVALATDTTYDLSPSLLARTTFLDQSLDIFQNGGFARIGRTCIGPPDDLSCSVSQLASLRILAADFSVSGIQVRNAEIRTNRPAPIVNGVIPDGELLLDVTGMVGSQQQRLLISNAGSSAVTVGATGISFRLDGALSLVAEGPTGRPMPVAVTITSFGTAAPGRGCDTATPGEKLFGFEDASRWRSVQATLSTVVTPKTEGCFSVGVAGSGYMVLESNRFAASVTGQPEKLSVDLFIPTSQPNPYWLGALQSYLECPSANLYNAFVGQVELTGRTTGQFSTLTFALPSHVRNVLRGSSTDCSVKLALNVNQTGQTWVLDRLRFLR